MQTLLLIAGFGALGCLSRHLISGWFYALLGRDFPYGTLAVNVLGAFLIGLIMEFGLRSAALSVDLRSGLVMGFLGGFTTFSSFSYETFRLLEDGGFLMAATNVLVSVLVCLFFTWAGIQTARAL